MKAMSLQMPDEMHIKLKEAAKKRNQSVSGYLKILVQRSLEEDFETNIKNIKENSEDASIYSRNIVRLVLENRLLCRDILNHFCNDEEISKKIAAIREQSLREFNSFSDHIQTNKGK